MDFNCLWKQSPVMGEDLRPDVCGVIFELYPEDKTIVAMVDEGRDWDTGGCKELISQMLRDEYVVWVEDGSKNLLLPEGTTEAEAHSRLMAVYERKVA